MGLFSAQENCYTGQNCFIFNIFSITDEGLMIALPPKKLTNKPSSSLSV